MVVKNLARWMAFLSKIYECCFKIGKCTALQLRFEIKMMERKKYAYFQTKQIGKSNELVLRLYFFNIDITF